MYKILNWVRDRQPLIEPFGCRSHIKSTIDAKIKRVLHPIFVQMISESRAQGWPEISAIAWVDWLTGELISFTYDTIGTYDKTAFHSKGRDFLNPRIIQISIHTHPPNTATEFSKDYDVPTISGRFFLRWDDESYVISYRAGGCVAVNRWINKYFC